MVPIVLQFQTYVCVRRFMYIHIFSADTNKCVMTMSKGIP